ncbi:MAG: DUF1461 domain-containing protein [Clostridium sp.]
MEDVRGLFLGGLWLRRIGLMFTLAFAALFIFLETGPVMTGAHTLASRQSPAPSAQGHLAFFAACLALAAVISTDFSRYFVVFHHIFLTTTCAGSSTQICSSTSYPRRSLWIRLCGSPLFLP